MKKNLLVILSLFCLFSTSMLKAQDFTQADTVWVNITPGTASSYVNDFITNKTSAPLKLNWHVIATNFPPDWLADTALGICDNNVCRGNGSFALWNGTTGTVYTSVPYAVGVPGAFQYAPNLTGATSVGCYYLTVNVGDLSYNKNTTFVVCKTASTTAVSSVNAGSNDIVLYPNPATSELNVVFSADADIKNIAVYNIIGKVMSVYKVNGESANLNLENIPSGIYFVRLVNSHGDVVVTRKFTKQ